MIYKSLAVLAIPRLFHLHPKAKQVDDRVSLTLMNQSMMFRAVTLGGQTYTVNGRSTLRIKAPAGTLVYAGKNSPTHRRGDVVLEVSPKLNGKTVDIN
jgi:hypothetical protein